MSSNAWLSGVSRFFTPLYWLVVIAFPPYVLMDSTNQTPEP
jgi:hypothetical protein